MANQFYGTAKASLLTQNPSIDFDTDTIKVALVGTGYTPNTATNGDQYYSVVGTHAIATATLSGKQIVGGVFDASDVTFTSVTGATVGKLVLYKDTGTASNSPLICYFDNGTGIPITPNGGDITISWDNGASKIFKL